MSVHHPARPQQPAQQIRSLSSGQQPAQNQLLQPAQIQQIRSLSSGQQLQQIQVFQPAQRSSSFGQIQPLQPARNTLTEKFRSDAARLTADMEAHTRRLEAVSRDAASRQLRAAATKIDLRQQKADKQERTFQALKRLSQKEENAIRQLGDPG